MNQSLIRYFILFFYFSFLDDQKALVCSLDAFHAYKSLFTGKTEDLDEVLFIQVCLKVFKKYRRRNIQINSIEAKRFGLASSISHQVPLSAWRDYLKSNTYGEVQKSTIIFSFILKLSENSIRQALNLSDGTLKYRTSHGLKSIGEFVNLNSMRVVEKI